MPNECFNKLTVNGCGYEKFFTENTNSDGILDFDISVPVGESRNVAYRKWNAEISGGGKDCNVWDKSNVIEFFSRWCPPKQYFHTISLKYPKLEFILEYDEFCMNIYGTSVFKNGCVSEVSRSICEHIEKTHGVTRKDVLVKLYKILSLYDETTLDDEDEEEIDKDYLLEFFRESYDIYTIEYFGNSDIDVKKEWNDYKSNSEKNIEQLEKDRDKIMNDIENNLTQIRNLNNIIALRRKGMKKRKKKTKYKPSGFLKPTCISDELAQFLGKESGTMMPRTEVTKQISKYVKKHKLQDPTNKRNIIPNEPLKKLLKLKDTENAVQLSWFNIQSYLKPHYLKN